MKSLYDEIYEAGIPLSSHESDLYFQSCPAAHEILTRHPVEKKSARFFRDQVSGESWIDVPFAYTPWWTRRYETGQRKI